MIRAKTSQNERYFRQNKKICISNQQESSSKPGADMINMIFSMNHHFENGVLTICLEGRIEN